MSNVTISKLSDGTNVGYFAPQAYFECSTAADASAKTATSPDSVAFTNTSLTRGITVFVKFVNANTADSPTLQIGTSTAKSISGETIWDAGDIISFTYDGTDWVRGDYKGTTYTGGNGIDITNNVVSVDNASGGHLSFDANNKLQVDVDNALSSSSTNPVQNSVIKTELDKKIPKATMSVSEDISVTPHTFTITSPATEEEQLALLNDAFDGNVELYVRVTNTDTIRLFKYSTSFNFFVFSALVFIDLYPNGVNTSNFTYDGTFNMFGVMFSKLATPKITMGYLTPTHSFADISAVGYSGDFSDLTNKPSYTASGLGAGKTITALSQTDGVISATASDIAIAGSQITSGTIAEARLPYSYVKKAGDTMTGDLIVPAERIANTYYGITFGRTTSTPVETILYTGIKWVSGRHMPVIHITGYAYGLSSPVEFKIGFYIYGDKIGWCGVTNMGSWNPSVYLFKYTRDSVDYVAVGLAGSCYFLQLQADVQDEMGKFGYIVTDSSAWSWSFLTETGTIPAVDDGTTCTKVPYKADILEAKRHPYWYGTCTTAAATYAKVVTCTDFVLTTGARISVRFTNGCTSSTTMSLNVNSTGAKNCGTYLYNGTWQAEAFRCEKNEVLEFIYDGTYWVALTPYYLRNVGTYASRLTSANRSNQNMGLEYFLATSSMTTGKPPTDNAAILNMNWDNGSAYGAQLAVAHGTTSMEPGRLWTRGQNGTSTWSSWREVPRLSGALTNGQIVVSDESTGNALLKGISYDHQLNPSSPYTDIDADTLSFSISNDELTAINDYMSSAISDGYLAMAHVNFSAPLPGSDTNEAAYIAHSASLDESDLKWVFSGTVYDSVDKTTYPFTFSYPIASTGPVTATVKLNRASSGGSLDPVEDTSVFLSRAVNFGENKYKFPSLVGGTVAWNQLWDETAIPSDSVIYSSTTYTANGVTFTKNGDGSISIQTVSTGATAVTQVKIASAERSRKNLVNAIQQRTHLVSGAPFGSATTYDIEYASRNVYGNGYLSAAHNSGFNMWIVVKSGAVIATAVKVYPQIFDLDIALGTTITAYMKSLGTGVNSAGVQWFKQYFPKSYYPYNAGALVSVNPTGAETVGVNQWDEEWEYGEINSTTGANSGSATTAWRTKNYIPVIPGGAYYVTAPVVSKNLKARFYDASKNYIGYTNKAGTNCFTMTAFTVPDNASYVRFGPAVSDIAVPNNNICVSISNPLYNGTYYPYTHHSYPISPVELRGIPKLSDGKLTFDGDVRASDGTVTRKYGIVDLGTCSYNTNTTGTNTYEAATSSFAKAKGIDNFICSKIAYSPYADDGQYGIRGYVSSGNIAIRVPISVASTPSAIKTALSGVYLVYELATPTTESSEALPVPQVVYDGGIESYIDERDVQVPVGQDATYMDATSAIGELMDSGLVPSSGGVSQTSGTFSLAGAGTTITSQWNYVKTGKEVTIYGGFANWMSSSTLTTLFGLPFTPAYSTPVHVSCYVLNVGKFDVVMKFNTDKTITIECATMTGTNGTVTYIAIPSSTFAYYLIYLTAEIRYITND